MSVLIKFSEESGLISRKMVVIPKRSVFSSIINVCKHQEKTDRGGLWQLFGGFQLF